MDESFPINLENPTEKSSFFSKLCFLWTTDCVSKCKKKNLELGDIYRCPEPYLSSDNGHFLEDSWKAEFGICSKKNKDPSLLRTLFKVYYRNYTPLAATAFLNFVVIKGLQPLMLSNLIRLFMNKNYGVLEMIFYGGGLSMLILSSSFLVHHTVCGSNLLAIRIRLALSSLVYRKVLKLSQKSLASISSGQVINLLSNDVGKFENAVQAFHFLWLTPIQLAVIIFIISNLFGLGALIGISSLVVIMVPFQGFLGHLTGLYRAKAAEKTDRRVNLMNEIFSGMEVIKMYTWEDLFQNFIQNVRKEELRYIRKSSFIRGILACMMFVTEKLGLWITVICYSLFGFPVTTDVVFSVSVCFRILQYSLGTMLPAAITIGSEVLVSIRRLEEFLLLEEIGYAAKTIGGDMHKGEIHLKEVSANWNDKDATLKDVSIWIPTGCLCGIVGSVGSGKSSILKLILGEMPKTQGSMKIKGTISFSSQAPWIFTSTIRKNILFSEEFNEFRYKKVVEVCGLAKDFEQFPNGDQTIAGSKGVNLSGGQRARISLARTIYKEADIYLLDDILSSLDAQVGRHVFEQCVLKFLEGKTRILVTHQMQILENFDHIIILNKGYIQEQGTFKDIFKIKLKSFEGTTLKRNERKLSSEEVSNYKNAAEEISNQKVAHLATDNLHYFKGSMILKYVKYSESYFSIAILFLFIIISQLSLNLSDYWLTIWSEQEHIRSTLNVPIPSSSIKLYENETMNLPKDENLQLLNTLNKTIISQWMDKIIVNQEIHYFIKTPVMRIVYTVIISLAVTFMLLRSTLFFHLCIKASRKLHYKMLSSFLKAPMEFFHRNPTGNMLNRFSKDMGAADELFPKALLSVLSSILILIGSMFLIVISNTLMLILIVPLCLILLKIRIWFVNTVKTLRRLETSERSPVFSYMATTLDGITTIRSSKCEKILTEQFDRHQDVHTACVHLAISCTSAFGLWIDLLCVLFVCCVILSFIFLDKYIHISGSFIGLAIFHSMAMVGLFQYCCRTLSETVNYLTNIERLLDYTQLENEEYAKYNDPFVPPRSWPSHGDIEFRNVNLKYPGKDELVLKNINLKIFGAEKIGIVGRTGAGKSSIITILFRLTKIEGAIFIDGINIDDIELKKFRREIAIIPQEPVLFSASVRFNLDPDFEFPDERIWNVIGDVGLQKSIPSLDLQLTEGGNNFSTGQRQLLCLVRAILKGSKILVLDEATANIDAKTELLIHKVIEEKFRNSTVLTVAHRLKTVLSSDRIIVMEGGKVVEFDEPLVLLKKENGYFRNLMKESGLETEEDT